MDLTKIIVKEIVSVLTVYSPRGRNISTNNRENYGLSFTGDGQITYTHNGKTFVSNKNKAVILPKGKTYDIHGDKEGIFPVINFECEDFFTDTIKELPVKNIETVLKEFEQLKNLFIHSKNHLLIMSCFYKLLYHISNEVECCINPLSTTIEFIENNYSSEISNEILARKCHLGVEHFRKQFKKIYKISPKQYVINTRIKMAQQMLSEGVLKINEIAERCGFSNPYHFCRLFKSMVGFTPSEYMKQNRIYRI